MLDGSPELFWEKKQETPSTRQIRRIRGDFEKFSNLLIQVLGFIIFNLRIRRGIVLHSVDATDLMNTLVSQGVDGIFDVIVFAFPRASLKRSVEPRTVLGWACKHEILRNMILFCLCGVSSGRKMKHRSRLNCRYNKFVWRFGI